MGNYFNLCWMEIITREFPPTARLGLGGLLACWLEHPYDLSAEKLGLRSEGYIASWTGGICLRCFTHLRKTARGLRIGLSFILTVILGFPSAQELRWLFPISPLRFQATHHDL